MEVIKKELKMCLSCMEEHEVEIVRVKEETIIHNELVSYMAVYEYCKSTDELTETEELIRTNNLSMKDAYRTKKNLLTSKEIICIRDSYHIGQKDFANVLGWGLATIARYETCQIQDLAHDEILRKIREDPKWYLELLRRARFRLNDKAYQKYYQWAQLVLEDKRDSYLRTYIEIEYNQFPEEITGNRELDIDKVVAVINVMAGKVRNLYKVKLMKLLWYADYLNYKVYGHSITGLAYRTLPLGAVPEAHESIISLKGITYSEELINDEVGYRFNIDQSANIDILDDYEKNTVYSVCDQLGNLNTRAIVSRMHEEEAYQATQLGALISYEYAKNLSINL